MAVPQTRFTGQVTAISGLLVFDVTRVNDSRGWFQEKYHREKLVTAGLPEAFRVVQTSVSFNRLGATRGFHAEPWDKYISIIDGRAHAAYLDLREGPTYGQVVEVELRGDNAVLAPAGVANSYQCLTDLYYLYSVNQHWSPDAYDRFSFVNLADPDVGIDWPIPLEQALLSEKDVNHPLLRDVKAIPLSSLPDNG